MRYPKKATIHKARDELLDMLIKQYEEATTYNNKQSSIRGRVIKSNIISLIRSSQFKLFFIGIILIILGVALILPTFIHYNNDYSPNSMVISSYSPNNFKEYINQEVLIKFLPVDNICIFCRGQDIYVEIFIDIPIDINSDEMYFPKNDPRLRADVPFMIEWPGEITHPYDYGAPLTISKREDKPFQYESVITGTMEYESTSNDNNKITRHYQSIAFTWINGSRSLSFTDREISMNAYFHEYTALFIMPYNTNLIQEVPAPIEVAAAGQVVPRSYRFGNKKTIASSDDLNIVYRDIYYQNITQFLLIISGILIGLGSNLISQVLINRIK